MTLWLYQQRLYSRAGHWDYDAEPMHYVVESTDPDPDIDDMIEALDAAIVGLLRWRRTGRNKSPRKAAGA
jgi:hypothetical protein